MLNAHDPVIQQKEENNNFAVIKYDKLYINGKILKNKQPANLPSKYKKREKKEKIHDLKNSKMSVKIFYISYK